MPAQYPGIGFPPSSAVGLLRRITNNLALIAAGGGGGGGITSLVAGAGISITNPTGPAATITATGSGNSYATATNNSGDTTITPTVSSYDIAITVGGAARTSNLILATAGRSTGDRVRLLMTFPVTTGIILVPRNATAGGTLLLPADIFTSPAQSYTTNGFDLSAVWEFEYTGSAWRFVTSNIPA